MRGDGKKNEQIGMKVEMTMKMEMNMEMEMEMVREKRRGNVARYTKGYRVLINTTT